MRCVAAAAHLASLWLAIRHLYTGCPNMPRFDVTLAGELQRDLIHYEI